MFTLSLPGECDQETFNIYVEGAVLTTAKEATLEVSTFNILAYIHACMHTYMYSRYPVVGLSFHGTLYFHLEIVLHRFDWHTVCGWWELVDLTHYLLVYEV